MSNESGKQSTLRGIWDYIRNLPDQSPYWRLQSLAWGIVLTVAVTGFAVQAHLMLRQVNGGGGIHYQAVGSPGPVSFNHSTHMRFADGKYKDCKACHEKPFATQKYGTYVFRALKDSPPVKLHIGKEVSTLFALTSQNLEESALVSFEVTRACATCATGSCHDGKESFSRLECLKCHTPK
jgi:hypothetical protein